MARIRISRHWRTPKTILALCILEFPLTVAILALFGIAAPDLYRTTLWKEGSDHGFNSNPNEILYSYANHKPIKIPLPWSQFITNFNLTISVLSMFLLLAKITMQVLHVFYPLISLVVHATLLALYAVSVHGQTAPDYSDPQHPSKIPWYISKSCGVSSTKRIEGYCQQAKASFVVTVLMLALFAVHVLLALFSLIPTKEQRLTRDTSVESAAMTTASPQTKMTTEQQWEMNRLQLPRTPGTTGGMKSPMTPRTVAFNVLGGGSTSGAGSDLPLRNR